MMPLRAADGLNAVGLCRVGHCYPPNDFGLYECLVMFGSGQAIGAVSVSNIIE